MKRRNCDGWRRRVKVGCDSARIFASYFVLSTQYDVRLKSRRRIDHSLATSVLCFLCSLLFICLVLVASFEAGAAPRPNIVVIMSDDMGYSDLGCYGGEIQTPTLD